MTWIKRKPCVVKDLFCPGCGFDFDPDLLDWERPECISGTMRIRATCECPECEMESYVDLDVDLKDGDIALSVEDGDGE